MDEYDGNILKEFPNLTGEKIVKNRIRKTITFKPSVLSKMYEKRGPKPLSAYINEFFESYFKIIKLKGGQNKKT